MRAALLLVIAACGGSSSTDLTGMYRVDVAVSSMPCGNDAPIAMPPAFLKFAKDEFLGQSYFKYDECKDEAGTDCPNSGGLFTGFFEPISNGWKGVVTSSSGAGGMCSLTYFEQTAVLKDLTLVVDASSFSDDVSLPDDQCEPEEAEKRGTDMPCEEHTRFEATKLP
jgi:hypothetical protein